VKTFLKSLLVSLVFIAPLIGYVSISGCATLTGANNAAAAGVQAGVQLVTALYIQKKGGGTAAGEAAVAQQVVAVAQDLEAVVTGTFTVAQFNSQAAVYIAKLTNPAEKILAAELLAQLDIYFAQVVANKGSIINATTTAAATVVLNDVMAACAFYLPAPAAGHR
jgi:hypothetical protein